MRIRLLCVGKPRRGETTRLHDDYAERIRRLGVRYEAAFVREEKPGGRFSDEHVQEREAQALASALGGRGSVVALHASGELLSSEELARRLERWSTPELTLVVGGPLGLHTSFLERCDHLWSLSPLTFPHELVRVVVAEQVYRALTVLRGVPYHK